jgi:integrase/recombinase XerD
VVAACQPTTPAALRNRAILLLLVHLGLRAVGRAIRAAGVAAPSYGAHVLGHSAATAMLRQGASLEQIPTVLRHRSVETTADYAKVDVTLLRQVAQPWPEVSPC